MLKQFNFYFKNQNGNNTYKMKLIIIIMLNDYCISI